MRRRCRLLAWITAALCGPAADAGSIIDTSLFVSGTTTSLTLDSAKIATPNGRVNLSNSGSDLVVNFDRNSSNSDFNLTWEGAADGVGFNTATYRYVKIDIVAASPGLVDGTWQMYWQDDDSTVGGGSDSMIQLGSVTPEAGPFSIIIDLDDGGTNITGAKGWGPGTLDIFRLDLFQNLANRGESITFGSQLSSNPGTGRINSFRITHRYANAADGYFTTPHQIKARVWWDKYRIIDGTFLQPISVTVDDQLDYQAGSQTADLYVPPSYDPAVPIGIYIHINAGETARLPQNLEPVFDQHSLIGASPDQTGNTRHDPERFARALDTVTTLKKHYNIDDSRVYVGGISGGALIAILSGMLYPDTFRGIIATEHALSPLYRDRIAKDEEVREMAANGQRWSHILGKDSYAYDQLASYPTSWKYDAWFDHSEPTTRIRYEPLFDCYNQQIEGMGHTNAAPEVFERSLIFVDAPTQLPKVGNYSDWVPYAFRQDDPDTIFFSYYIDEESPRAPDPTINLAPEDDFDGDGTNNWMEYLLATNPMIAGDRPLVPLMTMIGKTLSLNFRAGAGDYRVAVHTSVDLNEWNTTGDGAQVVDTRINSGTTMGQIRYVASDVTASSFFFRPVINSQPPR